MKRIVLLLMALPLCCLAAGGDAAHDYVAERYAFAARPEYNPYALQLAQVLLLDQHKQRSQDPASSIQEINEPLAKLDQLYPLGITVNRAVAGFLEYIAGAPGADGEDVNQARRQDLKDIAKARRAKADAILKGIMQGKDGSSPEQAYAVINITEEYEVLAELDLERDSQHVLDPAGAAYDVLVTHGKSGKKRTVYFDITRFYRPDDAQSEQEIRAAADALIAGVALPTDDAH